MSAEVIDFFEARDRLRPARDPLAETEFVMTLIVGSSTLLDIDAGKFGNVSAALHRRGAANIRAFLDSCEERGWKGKYRWGRKTAPVECLGKQELMRLGELGLEAPKEMRKSH
jgi:hypothetical protein